MEVVSGLQDLRMHGHPSDTVNADTEEGDDVEDEDDWLAL